MNEQQLHLGRSAESSCLSRAVTITNDDRKGRAIVATESIPAGSLILVERAFAFTLKIGASSRTSRLVCHNCLRRLDDTSKLNCPQCPHSEYVFFCCQECMDEARRTFHVYQCKHETLNCGNEKGMRITRSGVVRHKHRRDNLCDDV
jgi:hypothetical protein